MTRSRLDIVLVDRGLATSRTRAGRLIDDGLVSVDGIVASRPSLPVDPEQVVSVSEADHYVGRAARKLVSALDSFGIDPTGRLAIDVGASTGGFTQVLLERGASRVIALDVGHDQLDALIRDDERVIVVEGFNARELTRDTLVAASEVDEAPTLAVVDVSFIPLGLVLPALRASIADDADIVALVKPQFEVGRAGVRGGIVRDPVLRASAVMGVLTGAAEIGLGTAGFISSPIAGGAGNSEYLVHLSASASADPTEWEQQVTAATS